MMLRRTPRAALRPYVQALWLQDETAEAPRRLARERVLPTGTMHLVLRLTDHPLTLFDDVEAATGRTVGCALVGGARAGPYVREVGRSLRSVGAQLHAGAAQALLGVPAEALADRHTPLQDLWGHLAGEWRERLCETPGPEATLDLFEALLESRVARAPGVHPAVAGALLWLRESDDIGALVARTGYSHRHFLALFRRAVGLSPRVYCRVLRLQRALPLTTGRLDLPLSEVALVAGYSDQAHFSRELRVLTGLTPGALRALRPALPNHVEAQEVKSVQDRGPPGRKDCAP